MCRQELFLAFHQILSEACVEPPSRFVIGRTRELIAYLEGATVDGYHTLTQAAAARIDHAANAILGSKTFAPGPWSAANRVKTFNPNQQPA
jgi:hypothetical protein